MIKRGPHSDTSVSGCKARLVYHGDPGKTGCEFWDGDGFYEDVEVGICRAEMTELGGGVFHTQHELNRRRL